MNNDQSSFHVVDLKLDIEPSLNAAGAAPRIVLQQAAAGRPLRCTVRYTHCAGG